MHKIESGFGVRLTKKLIFNYLTPPDFINPKIPKKLAGIIASWMVPFSQ